MEHKAELEDLMMTLIREGGSDIHLSEGRHPSIRVAGTLLPLVKKPVMTPADTSAFLDILLSAENKKIFFETREMDFSYAFKTGDRFRGNAFFQQGTVSLALRLIPKVIRPLSELNLPEILESFTHKQQGFFLVVGPVGHGKTTTLAAMLDLINTNTSQHIVTVEDPIEYVFQQKKSIVDQREVGIDTADFRTALISMLREDVDVVLVGEMRDPETISMAVTAAETGHLVFSTLHTNDASQTISRIIDSFPAAQQAQIRIQLAGSLTGIFSQRLIPRVSGGMVPAYELLINNNAVSNLIRENRIHEINSVIQTGSGDGMIDLNHSLADLVRKGEITMESAYEFSLDPKILERLV